jgi:hypothetical protein
VHKNERTNDVEGICNDPPEVGEFFTMFGDALDPTKSIRRIVTTEVLEVTEDPDGKHLKFSTINSDYQWEEAV